MTINSQKKCNKKSVIYDTPFIVLLLFTLVQLLLQNAVAEIQTHKVYTQQDHTILDDKIWDKLALADSIRRTKPIKFNQLISDLTIYQDDFSIEEKYLYKLLYAYRLTYSGKYNEAKKHFQDILESNADNLIKFRANYTLISISAGQKKWNDGLTYLKINIKKLPFINNIEHYQASLLTTIIFYNQLKQYNISLAYIQLLSQESLVPKNDCLIQQLTLEAKLYLQQLQQSDISITNALFTCKNANYDIAEHIIRSYQAQIYLASGDVNNALNSLLPFLTDIKNTHYPLLISGVNNLIAKAYFQANDLKNSKIYVEEAKLTNKNRSNIEQAVDTYKLLFQIAKAENNHQLALSYHEKYAELDKANLDETKAKHLAFQLAEHQAYEQESQIKLLNEQNHALAAEQALAKTQAANRKLIILLLALVILVFTFLGMRFWRTHKRVKELAEYDPLTGIFNRGHFTQVSHSALKYCQNAKQDLSLIMFDLDHFKKVNDSFGHACGDWALKETIRVCKNIGRKNDIFARLGGEEFCLVLPSCNIDAAMLRAEACRAAIEDIITEASGCEFTITASFGVTDVKRSGFDLDKLLADADFAAYSSKNAGRNRVTLFEVPVNEAEEKLDSSWGYS